MLALFPQITSQLPALGKLRLHPRLQSAQQRRGEGLGGELGELPGADAMRLSRAWTEKHWCESVEEPEWPFAYEKFPGHEFEKKGRTNSNKYVRRSTKKRPMR